ncbi:MAG: 23S rRNA (guanosine(2251)-2'-O)-methyltransferase RlmB [Bacteroidota bacterium]|nr:23S rRNA (guanosine(2251)-2'-O)-methyltransferase RlmB [Bacteroidota bacterium]
MERDKMIYGVRPVIEALQAGNEIEKVLVVTGVKSEQFPELRKLLSEKDIPMQYVPVEKLNRLTRQNHQGVIAFVSPIVYENYEQIVPALYDIGRNPLVLVLDRITDVRNFGAIARTAECAGVDVIIVPSRGSALMGADAIKTSAGALFKIPVCRSANIKDTIDYLKACGLQVVAATEKAKDYHFQTDFTIPTAIIMGSEEDGVSPEYLKRCDKRVRIPMVGEIASLNVSVAAGIILFEAVRQRI